ncbi:MAG TPA: dienelactone hydrolase family protein [Gemmataceae bacterium]|nr:dienelactone hydrolase family protein [Gemmataceae bacterium]
MIAVRMLALAGVAVLVLPALPLYNRAAAAEAAKGFQDRVHKDADGKEAKYVLFVPHDYKGDKPYPLILFLHGSGETGTDGIKQTKVGLAPAIKKNEKTFPFLAIFPQSQKRTWRASSNDAKRALDILAEVEKEYKVDAKRVYLTGLSMGGFGTWSLAVAHPNKWAAIVPICGGGDPKQADKIKDIPCWCFHGDADKAVKVEGSRKMIDALKKAGGEPKYTEYPGVGHNSWDKAYGTKELYPWLLEQHKK